MGQRVKGDVAASEGDTGAPVAKHFYGIVAGGRPLSRAVWTESRELAEDMLRNGAQPAELWQATLLVRGE
jgi:hypothetical protein